MSYHCYLLINVTIGYLAYFGVLDSLTDMNIFYDYEVNYKN